MAESAFRGTADLEECKPRLPVLTQNGILGFNFSFPAQEGSLSGQPLCFQAFPIFVERLLRFFVIGQSLFRLDLSKRLSCFALRGRRFAPCNGFVFGHF
jgi:hypothetical protein